MPRAAARRTRRLTAVEPARSPRRVGIDRATGRYATNGAYALAAVGSSDGMGRLLYTGATEPGDIATTQNALYAADSCGSMTSPEIGNVNDPACEPAEVSAWDRPRARS